MSFTFKQFLIEVHTAEEDLDFEELVERAKEMKAETSDSDDDQQ